MRRALTLAIPLLLMIVPATTFAPTATAASAEIVGTLDLPPLPDGSENGLVGASAVFLNGKTYVLGGRLADYTYSRDIWEYDHATGQVRKVAQLPSGRQSGTAMAIDGKIYYLGGAVLVQADINGDGTQESVPQSTSEIVEFNPATGTARAMLLKLPTGAWGLSSTAFGSRGYVFGGLSFDFTKPQEIERRDWIVRFTPSTNEVRQVSSRLPYAVQDAGAALLGNRIYLFGGLTNNDNVTNPCPMARSSDGSEERMAVCTTDRIVAFDPGLEVAVVHDAKLPQRVQFIHAGAVGARAYIPGGRLHDGTASPNVVEFAPGEQSPVRTLVPTLPRGIYSPAVSVDAQGALFVIGGRYGQISELVDDVVKVVPGPTPPYPPRALATTPIDGGVRLSWEPPAYDGGAPVVAYRVYRTDPGAGESRLAEVNGLTHDDTTARPGIEYAYRVTAVNSAGESPIGASTSRAADATVPGTVRELRAYAGNAEVVLRWLPPAEDGGSALTGYRVYRDQSLLRALPPSPAEFRDTGLENGKTYRYTVVAVNAKGEGAAVPARAATPAPVPEAPSSLHATPDAGGVRLTWAASGTAADRFVVHRGTTPGDLTPITEVTATEYLDAGLARGKTYYYAVSAANAVGESPPSEVASASLVSEPGQPQNVFAAPVEGGIRLTWQPPADTGEADPATLRYFVSRQDPGSGAFNPLQEGSDLSATSFTDTRVLPGREYAYTVTAFNGLLGAPSDEARGVAKEIPNQPPVAFLEPSSREVAVGEEVTLDASKSSDPDGKIAYYLFDFGDGSRVVNTTEPTATHAYATNQFATVSVRVVDERGAQSAPVTQSLQVGTPEQRPDGTGTDVGGANGATKSGGPGSSPGKIPGPGALGALVAALAAAVLLARGRHRAR